MYKPNKCLKMFHFSRNSSNLVKYSHKLAKMPSIQTRQYSSKEVKRFYKQVSLSQSEGGGFEINLDKRKLKTPSGTLFKVPNETLAVAVATEWEMQKEVINKHNMHMTHLCSVAIDNPSQRDKSSVARAMLEYLDTDTICYRVEEPEELAELQHKEWDPLLQFCKDRYGVEIAATSGLGVPVIPQHTTDILTQHFHSYNDWALVGYQSAVECLKSVIIAMSLIDRYITVEEAVHLSRLEAEFQIRRWGNIEWYHDIDLMATRARLAASVLMVHLNCEDIRTVFNKHSNTAGS